RSLSPAGARPRHRRRPTRRASGGPPSTSTTPRPAASGLHRHALTVSRRWRRVPSTWPPAAPAPPAARPASVRRRRAVTAGRRRCGCCASPWRRREGMSPPGGAATPVSALRARLAAMGGLVDLSRPLPPPRVFRSEPPPPPAERAGALGFVAEGAVLVRRVRVDLGPFLDRAGADGPAAPPDLVRLLYRLSPDAPAGPFSDGDAMVLDIETLGLRGSGVVPFLVGLGVPRGRFLEIDQYLLADLGGEGPMLDAVAARVGTSRVLLTYNGRGFDIPVLRARCIINRRPADAICPAIHCDLLGPVRRLFRERLGSCTLRQVEVSLLGLVREDDVPGAEAPARFRAWLDGGPPSVLEGVIRHNQLDLCSTVV